MMKYGDGGTEKMNGVDHIRNCPSASAIQYYVGHVNVVWGRVNWGLPRGSSSKTNLFACGLWERRNVEKPILFYKKEDMILL